MRNVAKASQNAYLVLVLYHCLGLKRSDQRYKWALGLVGGVSMARQMLAPEGGWEWGCFLAVTTTPLTVL